MKLRKLLPCLLALAAIPAFADATTAVPKKVGPVSFYGALHTSGGKIIGEKNNQEAMLRGMSLFWSDATGLPYYRKDVINWAVDNLKIDIIRFPMGITYYDSDGGTKDALATGFGYSNSPDSYKRFVDQMVQYAVENDIYIIIDWHSHRAQEETALAKDFFKEIAAKYAKIPNVIYEIYNEPVQTGWSDVKNYASQVIPGIRASTENLVIVGTPNWSQLTEYGGVSGTNIAYVFHFYAGTHSTGSFGNKIEAAQNSGNPVIISEWGTVGATGAGSVDPTSSQNWINFMESHKLINCNWSLRQTSGKETSALFDGDVELSSQGLLEKATYSQSGQIVKKYLIDHAQSWSDSLLKGKNTGSCAFKAATAKQTDGKVSGVLKSGCTYTSSNDKVVSVSGSDLTINDAGYAILTGNDGSESIVTILEVAGQTIPNFTDMTCSYGRASSHVCSINRGANYSGKNPNQNTFDWVLAIDSKTQEGADFTIKSLNPDIVDVQKLKCVDKTYCSTNQSAANSVIMYQFKSIGTAKIVATAPAVTGYRAMNDTIEVSYRKNNNMVTSKFVSTKVPLNGTLEKFLQDTTLMGAPVTYKYNDEDVSPYVAKSGNTLVAGGENALVYITATAPGSEYYEDLSFTILVTVGDSALAVNLDQFASLPKVKRTEFNAQFSNDGFSVFAANAKPVEVSVVDVNGVQKFGKTLNMAIGARFVSLKNLSAGQYIVKFKQGSAVRSFRWTKK